MGIVLPVIAVLCGLVVLVLAVPLEVAFRLEAIEALQGRLTLRWLFGLLRVRIPVPGARKPAPKAKAEALAAKVRARPKGRRGRRKVLAALGQKAFRRRAYRLVRDLVRAVHLRQLRLRMRLGLDDPADTGRLWAVVGPLSAAARCLRDAEVRIEPDFLEPVLELQASGRLRVVPLRVLVLAIAFALSPPSLRAWRTLRGSHA